MPDCMEREGMQRSNSVTFLGGRGRWGVNLDSEKAKHAQAKKAQAAIFVLSQTVVQTLFLGLLLTNKFSPKIPNLNLILFIPC